MSVERNEIPHEWGRLLAGLVGAFALFQLLAHTLSSDRGQAGLAIAAAVIAALLTIECFLFGQTPTTAMRLLGLRPPTALGVIVAAALSGVLLAVIPLFASMRGASLGVYPGWMWLLPGLFAQAGIAEEVLFRGYLFRRLREGRSFWQAALLSAVPFVAVHLFMFATLPWMIALAAVLLATAISFPLAHLFELGGNSIWGPALLHFTVQGAIKVLEVPGDAFMPLVWMAASAAIPCLAFLIPRTLLAPRS